MITDEQTREIALFFLFSLLDQRVALQAAHKAIAQVKALPTDEGVISKSDIARILKRGFETHRKLLPRNQPIEISETALSMPEGTDFATWQKFHVAASDHEITAVVLAKILGYDEEVLADGFQVSVGTMKYRISKGMRQLGSVVK
ncbi:MAG: hypothetical protein EOP05_07995 [Proteobacteria bacterium]|nr:MAG: hypothetical protein EOP05_07995 [Pseudomonadota bacterium]